VGYSLGARVVWRCLQQLAAHRHAGCVEHAILIAAPVAPSSHNWAAARAVVAGRLANVWSSKDWLLGVLHRLQVCGCVSVALVARHHSWAVSCRLTAVSTCH
jgi:pimeloyl-ACP methyl ester carboxylesterase